MMKFPSTPITNHTALHTAKRNFECFVFYGSYDLLQCTLSSNYTNYRKITKKTISHIRTKRARQKYLLKDLFRLAL